MAVPTCAFRADAGPKTGAGHVVRCIALARELNAQGWHCTLLTHSDSEPAVGSFGSSDIDIHCIEGDPDDEIRQISTIWPSGLDAIIVDHYERDATYEAALHSIATAVVAFDDVPERRHACDFLIDFSYGRERDAYANLVPAGAVIATGTDYAVLRPEFSKLRDTAVSRRARNEMSRVLVSLGAFTSPVVDEAIADAVMRCDLDVDYDYVLSPYAKYADRMTQRLSMLRRPADAQLGTPDMAGAMAAADLAIGAPGVTSWERCCLGLPAILLVVADNQVHNGRVLAAAGAAEVLDWRAGVDTDALAQHLLRLATSSTDRIRMSASAASICDGGGAVRIAGLLSKLVENKAAMEGRRCRV